MRSSPFSPLHLSLQSFSHLTTTKKGLILAGAAAALIASGAAIPKLNAAEPVKVEVVATSDKNGCPNGCPHKKSGGSKKSRSQSSSSNFDSEQSALEKGTDRQNDLPPGD